MGHRRRIKIAAPEVLGSQAADRVRPHHPGLAALRALGLDVGATADDVRAAFRRKAHEEHPDKGGLGDMGKLVEIRDRALGYVEP